MAKLKKSKKKEVKKELVKPVVEGVHPDYDPAIPQKKQRHLS